MHLLSLAPVSCPVCYVHALIRAIDCLDLSLKIKIINTRKPKDITPMSKLLILWLMITAPEEKKAEKISYP